MTVRQLLVANRSVRRFHSSAAIDETTLLGLVELTRFCASAANRQPLKYAISWEPERNASIFPHLRWAAAMRNWGGPAEDERPTGYIIILGDTQIARQFDLDCGIAAQSILLGAVEQGLRGCMIGSIDRDGLRGELSIDPALKILLVLALGRPNETVVLEDGMPPEGRSYWRDNEGVHHVPKRSLRDLLVDLR